MENKYSKIAGIIDAYKRCIERNNQGWIDKHDDYIRNFELNQLPSGSGFDSGCTFNRDASTINKLVIDTSYHCMNEGGFYDGWLDFQVIITPTFSGIDIKLKNRTGSINRKITRKYWDISKDCFYDTFSS